MMLGVAATVIAVAGAAFFTRDEWLPRPALELTSTEVNGSLVIRWNPEALRGIEHASMLVNDGGQPTPAEIPLDHFQLTSGLFSYIPKSTRVTAKLDAGETTAMTVWFAAPLPAPVAPTGAASSVVPSSVGTALPDKPTPAARGTHPAVDEVKTKP